MMDENTQVKKAIEEITYYTSKFPEEQFEILSGHPEEAAPYLIEGIKEALEKLYTMDESYELHMYAFYLLAQFGRTDVFPMFLELMSYDDETLRGLMGDMLTEGLNDVLYSTYDGNWGALKSYITSEAGSSYAKGAALDLCVQLYWDHEVGRKEIEELFKKLIYAPETEDYEVDTQLVGDICGCHFCSMLPDIKYLFEQERVEEFVWGDYADCVDMMFSYSEYFRTGCRKIIDAAGELRNWAMFAEPDTKKRPTDKILKKMISESQRGINIQEKKVKIYPNDPCPCGSGKKYKKCCMNKVKSAENAVQFDMEADRKKWLKSYPSEAKQRVEGRVYLEDYYDRDSIETDKLLFLAIKHKQMFSMSIGEKAGEIKYQIIYLRKAFSQYALRCEKEEIKTFREYDEKYGIHYNSKDWIEELERLLEEQGEKEEAKKVREFASGR